MDLEIGDFAMTNSIQFGRFSVAMVDYQRVLQKPSTVVTSNNLLIIYTSPLLLLFFFVRDLQFILVVLVIGGNKSVMMRDECNIVLLLSLLISDYNVF